MKLTYLLFISLICSCASKPKFKNLPNSDDIKIKYIIIYPNYSGQTKTEAKTKRRKFMEETMMNIYASIFRLGYFGRKDFTQIDFGGLGEAKLNYGNIPFVYNQGNPPTLNYNYFTQERERYGTVWSTSYRKGNKKFSGGKYVWRLPIAVTKNNDYIVSPKRIQDSINANIVILSKTQFMKLLNQFYSNHQIIDAKSVFIEFLRNHGYEFTNHTQPIRSLYKELFTKSKRLQSGAGLSDETSSLENTLNFSLQGEKNKQFIWGLTFLLNSKISAKRLNKEKLQVILEVPIKSISKNYKIEELSKYIE